MTITAMLDYASVLVFAASGARVPGNGKLKAIEEAPGRYVRTR